MQIVNGYICMNCCDVDKARLGQDPHQSADQLQKQIENRLDKDTTDNFGPAVAFGGSLQGPNQNAPLNSQAGLGANLSTSSPSIDVCA